MSKTGVDFDVSYREIDELDNGPLKALQYAVCGLLTDGGHHKQWALEKIVESLGFNLDDVCFDLEELDYSWEEGIAP